MAELYCLGFDASSTGAGAVLLGPDDRIRMSWFWQMDSKPKENTDDARTNSIRRWVTMIFAQLERANYLSEPGIVVSCSIERSFVRGSSSALLAGVHWIVRSTHAAEWAAYTAQSVKGTAHALTGIRTAGEKGLGKEPMREAAGLQFGHGPIDELEWKCRQADMPGKALEDLIDALWVAKTDQLAAASTRQEQP